MANHTIALNQRLRMFVPRVYGLGDLSQILDERAYAQSQALLDYLQEDLATFVITDAYRRAARAVLDHGFCLLLGEPAVGKSVIAATLAMTALDSWGCLTVRADGPEEVISRWNPNEPNQFFWIDDAFGSVRHEQALTDDWARRMPKVMAAIKGGARVVLTSRDYIYRAVRPSSRSTHIRCYGSTRLLSTWRSSQFRSDSRLYIITFGLAISRRAFGRL